MTVPPPSPRPNASRWRTLRLFWREAQWPFIWALALVTVLLGCRGFARYAAAAGETRSVADLLYATLQLFVLELGTVEPPLPWELDLARFLAPLVGVYTATRALAVLFREQLQQLRARLRRGHVIVCGLGRTGALVAQAFRRRGDVVVAIERDDGNDDIEPCRDAGIPVFVGDARDPDLLRRAGVGRARLLVAVTGGDGVNAEIAASARDLCGERRGAPLLCLVHLFDPDLCALLRAEELGGEHAGGVRLEFFNIFEAGGTQMAALVPWPPPGPGAAARAPRLLVVGLGNLGECLVVEAARGWQARRPPGGAPLEVVLVDQVAGERQRGLEVRHAWLQEVCRLEAWEGDVRSPEFEQGGFAAAPLDAAFVCLEDESLALAAGLDLLRRLRGQQTPIVVRLAEEAGLARLLGGGRFARLRGFGLLDRTCRPEVLLETSRERLARALHDDYLRSPVGAAGAAAVAWEALAAEFQESNRAQADDIGRKLAAIGCELRRGTGVRVALAPEEVELLARLEHARWLEERRRAGWTHAPGPKDAERCTNPHLVPWEELSAEARETTRSSVRGLPAFLASIGFEMRRGATPGTGRR